jgi:hypothetical protein
MSYVGKITTEEISNALVASTLYGTCDTAADVAAKVVQCPEFDRLMTGVTIHIKFTNENTANGAGLNVNGLGLKRITNGHSWKKGAVVSFTYDGDCWVSNNFREDGDVIIDRFCTEDDEYGIILCEDPDIVIIGTGTERLHSATTITYNPGKKALTVGNRKSGSTVGNYSVAKGKDVIASGSNSHADGYLTTASGSGSYAEGVGTVANHAYQHVFGTYNIVDDSIYPAYQKGNYIEIVGNGTSTTPANARTLDWDGNEILAGSLTIGGDIINETRPWGDNLDFSLRQSIQLLSRNKQNELRAGTKVVTFTNGSAMVDWSELGGSSGRVNTMILTCQSKRCALQYDFDNSTSSQAKINIVGDYSSSESIRFCYIIKT